MLIPIGPVLSHADFSELLAHAKEEEGCVPSCLPTENVLWTPQNTPGHSKVPCVQQVCVWVCPKEAQETLQEGFPPRSGRRWL